MAFGMGGSAARVPMVFSRHRRSVAAEKNDSVRQAPEEQGFQGSTRASPFAGGCPVTRLLVDCQSESARTRKRRESIGDDGGAIGHYDW
ncbi:hypothetical protein N7539_003533 [Penicillium diatomitis]|uniref:Uncharacterized protein n=1 Tax=Penicillium diatomitis TaxID=2819901 RepID=A0A9W9XCR2_9EURO|nr:uncharacterized protein N7539_003533 [Penicillium diatomitis]KAJ5488643.1 hypothetical protein N7539_003533 [Penicillium diatomitis]